jgi:hypothetical protein
MAFSRMPLQRSRTASFAKHPAGCGREAGDFEKVVAPVCYLGRNYEVVSAERVLTGIPDSQGTPVWHMPQP